MWLVLLSFRYLDKTRVARPRPYAYPYPHTCDDCRCFVVEIRPSRALKRPSGLLRSVLPASDGRLGGGGTAIAPLPGVTHDERLLLSSTLERQLNISEGMSTSTRSLALRELDHLLELHLSRLLP